MSSESPLRSLVPLRESASWTTRSSSVVPTTSARRGWPSIGSSSSLRVTTSPERSKPRASTTFMASLSMSSWPYCSASPSTAGETDTRSLRPPVKTSTVPSSKRPRNTP